MIDLKKIQQSHIGIIVGIVAIVVIVILSIIPTCETVTLTFEVLDNYGQPVTNKVLVIEGLEKEPLEKETDNDGFIKFTSKICQQEQSIIVNLATRDFPEYTKGFTVLMNNPKQKFQIRLGINTVRLDLIILPKEARYKLFNSNNEKDSEGTGGGQIDVLPKTTYRLKVFSPDKKIYKDSILVFSMDEERKKINLELNKIEDTSSSHGVEDAADDDVPLPDQVSLFININPSSGRWELRDEDSKSPILQGKNDRTVKIVKNRDYVLIGFNTEKGYTNIKSEKSVRARKDTTIDIDVRPKDNWGALTIDVKPNNASWEIINLGNRKTFKKGKGSTQINKVPLGKYQIIFKYRKTIKRSEIIVFTITDYEYLANMDLVELVDIINHCNNEDECIINEYEKCLDEDCDVQCSAYKIVANAYLNEGLDDKGLQVFEDGLNSTTCNLINNKNYLQTYFNYLFRTDKYEDIEKRGLELLEIAMASTDYQLEGHVLPRRYINTYNLINKKLNIDRRSQEVCELFDRSEEDEARIEWLKNTLNSPLQDVSMIKSAIRQLKFRSTQCQ